MEKELICVNCPMGCRITAKIEDHRVVSLSGYTCSRGKQYAEKELIRPERILTTTIRIEGAMHRVLPVITSREIPLDQMMDAMKILRTLQAEAPVKEGDVLLENLLGTGADVVASRSMERV